MTTLKDKPLKKCHTDKRQMIDDLHQNIVQTLDEEEKISYYLENGIILDEYYKNLNQSNNKNVDNLDNKNSILSYFKKKNENGDDNDNDDNSKKLLINNYMCNIDDTFLNDKFKNDELEKCPECNLNLLYNQNEGVLLCNKCGFTENIIIISEKGSYNDPPREASYFAYKRINHFNEWLAQFQAKETTELPESIYQDIYDELNKNIDFNIETINYNQIREILKKLKYNKYYEHIPHLINVVTGKKAPRLTRHSEEMLRNLFKEIQIPFMNNCPSSRKNFLSYSYVLHKFCELLEYDHLLNFFPLLKSREKLQQQDIIWKKICKDLQWQYIPSI